MGIFDKLDDPLKPAGKIAGRVLKKTAKPIFKPVGKVALKGAEQAGKFFESLPTSQLARTEAVKIGIWFDHPEALYDDEVFQREWKRRTGSSQPYNQFEHIGDAFRGRVTDTRFRSARDRGYENTDPVVRIVGEIIADPLTYAGISGAKLVTGAKLGPTVFAKTLGRELITSTGVGPVLKAPLAPVGIYKDLRNARFVGGARLAAENVRLIEGLEDAKSVRFAQLSDAQRANALDNAKTLRDSINAELRGDVSADGLRARLRAQARMPQFRTLQEKYAALAAETGRLAGSTLDEANYLERVRHGRATQFIGTRVNFLEEALKAKIAYEREAPFARRLPGVKQAFDFVSPITLEDDPIKLLAHGRGQALDQIQGEWSLMGDYLNARARIVGLQADPTTGLIALADGTTAELRAVLRNPDAYKLTGAQYDVIRAFHTGRQKVAETVAQFLRSTDEPLDKATQQWVELLGKNNGDEYFVPKVAIGIAETPEILADYRRGAQRPFTQSLAGAAGRKLQSALAPTAGRATKLPKGFEPVKPFKKGLGAKQATEFARVLEEDEAAGRVLFAHRVGDIFQGYAGQLAQIAIDDGTVLPALKKLGKTPAQLLGTEFTHAVNQASGLRDKLGKVQRLVASAGRGDRVSRRTLATLRRYAADEALDEETRAAIEAVTTRADVFITQEELTAGAVRRGGEKLGQAGRQLERVAGPAVQRQRPFTGPAFRVESGFRAEGSAADVVRFEEQELGNVLGVSDELLEELSQYRASDIVWVGRTKKSVARYSEEAGDIAGVTLGKGARIIARDGGGGFLVLRDAKPSARPPSRLAIAQQGREAQEIAEQVAGVGFRPQERAARVSRLREEANAIQDELSFGEKVQLQRLGIDPQDIDNPDAIRAIRGNAPEIAAKLEPFFARVEAARAAIPSASERNILSDLETLRKQMRETAQAHLQTINEKFGGAGVALGVARANKARALKARTLFDLRQQTTIPSLSGRWFDKKVAETINTAFGVPDRDTLLTGVSKFTAITQSLQAGIDMSATFLQSLATLPANPFGWAKAFSYGLGSMVNPDIYWRYLEGLSMAVDPASGRTWGEILARSKVSMSATEAYAPTEALAQMGVAGWTQGAPARVADFIGGLRPNRAFSIQRNVAAAELARAQIGLEQAVLRRALTDEELSSVGRQIDLATGAVSSRHLGISPTRATAERLVGRFGVQWFRSQTGRLVQAFNSGMDGRLARRILFQQVAAMSALYFAAATALGQEPNFDPSSRDFGTLKIGASRVGFGGIFHSVLRTVGESAEAAAKGDTKRFLDIKNGRNPILNFWRNGAPTMGGLIADQIFEINANTRFSKPQPWETVIPFSAAAAIDTDLQDASLLDRAIAGGTSGMGLRQTPQTPTDFWRVTSTQAATEAGYTSWDEIPKATQTRMIRDNPELTHADELRQKWFDRGRATALDVAFDQTGKSRDAMNDTLAALWARVQAGQMDKNEWRQVYADWSARHAYFSENVFGSLPDKEKKELDKEPKNVQDKFAARFQAIQPVDSDEDGIISEDDWKVWRSERDAFWQQNPDALQYRDYILFEYPTRVWKDPIMQQADGERRAAADLYDQYVDIPKYKGMTLDEGAIFDQLLSAKDRASKELRSAAEARGLDTSRIRIPAALAWQYAVQQLRAGGFQFTERNARLFKLAVLAEKKDEVKLQLINPARFQYIRLNPLVVEWYPSALRDTGLPERVLARLGLIQEPGGESLVERGAALAGVGA